MRPLPFALAVALLAAGCGGPAPVPADGVIKINGRPAGNLLIQLTPITPGETKVVGASAVSDEGGRFRLKADNGSAGAFPGAYKVMVIDNNLNVEDEPGSGKKAPANRVPTSYSSAASPLELKIEAGKAEYELTLVTR